MPWYGWIPILTNSLYPKKHVKDLKERSELIKNSYFLIPSKSEFTDFKEKIEELKSIISPINNHSILFRFIITDYLHLSYSLLNIISVDKNGIIKKIYLLDENYEILGEANIDFIRPNSLVKFHFSYISDFINEITVAWITRQLNLRDYIQMIVLSILSIIVLTPCFYFIINSNKHLNNILSLIKKL